MAHSRPPSSSPGRPAAHGPGSRAAPSSDAVPDGDPRFPDPVLDVARSLAERGHGAWLTGEGLHRALLGATAGPFELLTSAPASAIAERLPHAVAIAPGGRLFAVPTAAGPVDVAPCPCPADTPDPCLARRDFTLHASAWDVASGRLLDPEDGRGDWRKRRLRCPGHALERLRESPARVWRALRCVSESGLTADPELAAALPAAAAPLRPAGALAARRELLAWLSLDDPGPGLALARASGLEAVVAPGARPDTGDRWRAVSAPAPLRTALRLAIWLRGAPAAEFLRLLRMGEPLSSEVLRLIAHHPIERSVDPGNDSAVGRLLRRLGPEWLDALVAWRRSEIDAGEAHPEAAAGLARLAATRQRVAELRKRQQRRMALALDGRAVMDHLGCGPGPRVGRALRALSDWVAEDPRRNTAEALRERLDAWARGAS